MTMPFNEEYRFGSAAWAEREEIEAAGLFRAHGLQIGYCDQRPLYLDGDAPLITIGGAGSGKLRDLLAYVVCKSVGQRMVILDRS
jgi:type IV secretion system protein VirD4